MSKNEGCDGNLENFWMGRKLLSKWTKIIALLDENYFWDGNLASLKFIVKFEEQFKFSENLPKII